MKLWTCLLLGLLLVGCADRKADSAADEATADADPPAAAPADGQAPAEDNKPVPFTKREAKLVDKEKAMAENASLVEVENKIDASDPLTAASQSYFNMASRVHVSALKHNVDIMKAMNDRWPTFEEFDGLMKQNNIKLKGLYEWQMYAYDAETGGICILEDRAEKKRRYEASGRDYPHDD